MMKRKTAFGYMHTYNMKIGKTKSTGTRHDHCMNAHARALSQWIYAYLYALLPIVFDDCKS